MSNSEQLRSLLARAAGPMTSRTICIALGCSEKADRDRVYNLLSALASKRRGIRRTASGEYEAIPGWSSSRAYPAAPLAKGGEDAPPASRGGALGPLGAHLFGNAMSIAKPLSAALGAAGVVARLTEPQQSANLLRDALAEAQHLEATARGLLRDTERLRARIEAALA